MNHLLRIEPILEGQKQTIYTIRFLDKDGNSEDLSETEKFFKGIKESHPEDYQMFKAMLKNIIDISGARHKFFRDEGNSDCNYLKALVRENIEGTKYKGECRLFCLHYDSERLILGNGGVKKTRTFNEDAKLSKSAKALQELDPLIYDLEKEKMLTWKGSKLVFDFNHKFEIDL